MAGTVCAVIQGSEGMGKQPAGVEEGVMQAQSGEEVAEAPIKRGQDVVGNGGQEVQQQQHVEKGLVSGE